MLDVYLAAEHLFGKALNQYWRWTADMRLFSRQYVHVVVSGRKAGHRRLYGREAWSLFACEVSAMSCFSSAPVVGNALSETES